MQTAKPERRAQLLNLNAAFTARATRRVAQMGVHPCAAGAAPSSRGERHGGLRRELQGGVLGLLCGGPCAPAVTP
eukprot:15447376-Alexandrium_andersonii.AAC.1